MVERLLIGGDLFFKKKYSSKRMVGESVQNLFDEADFRILNLEAPVTAGKEFNQIEKTGPHLRMESKEAEVILNALNIDLVTLANNHIMDYGKKGLNDTKDFLNKNCTSFVGVGNNLNEAQQPFYLKLKSCKIALLNFAENEWANAGSDQSGATPLDIIGNVRALNEAQKKSDFVFVIIHGGNEYYNYPSPRMVKQYRFYAENGASVIIGHHPHCIGGYEVYKDVPIFYSLGNFLFTKQSTRDARYLGLILQLVVENEKLDFEILPVRQERGTFNLEILKGKERKIVEKRLNSINNVIQNPQKLQEKWQEFVNSRSDGYLMSISPFEGISNRYIRALVKRSGLYKIFYSDRLKRRLLNRVRCEAHRDVVITMLENELS